jgi:hypothetical protein
VILLAKNTEELVVVVGDTGDTTTHLGETKLKIVVLLSRVERDKVLGEIVNSQLTPTR